MVTINVNDLDAETRARMGLTEQLAAEPISVRLVILGRVLANLKGLNTADGIWVLSQALFAVEKEMIDEPEDEATPPIGFTLYTVAKAFDLEIADLLARSRQVAMVEARQTAMYILWNSEGYTLTKIGQALGGRSAATVSHGFQTIASRLSKDGGLRAKVLTIKNTLRKGEASEVEYLLTNGK